jgi:hypothetical protein
VNDPRCGFPVDIGQCRASRPKFYFDSSSNSCKRFFYGGCEGNGNRFNSEEECSESCVFLDSIIVNSEENAVEEKEDEEETVPVPASKPSQCKFGDNAYTRGEIVLFSSNQCKSCVCDSPPQLSCRQKTCPDFDEAPHLECRLKKTAEGGCCHEWKCSSGPDVPYVEEKE